jgi:diguanylate cyclase (GGDEF)-like protein
VQDREQAEAELRCAQIDQLTGALGRELGISTLEREINRARHGNGRLVLAYVDVDGLKQVNDRLGHAAGDALLRDVVAAIQPHLRSYDPIVRVGGDEFVCALGQCVPEDAHRRFQAIAATLARTRPGASISVGFAELRPEDTLEQLTQRGDRALYEAKQST